MRIQLRLNGADPQEKVIVDHLGALAAAQRPEYLRRLLTIGMTVLYGPTLDAVPPAFTGAAYSQRLSGPVVRFHIFDMDAVDSDLIERLDNASLPRRNELLRHALLAGYDALYHGRPPTRATAPDARPPHISADADMSTNDAPIPTAASKPSQRPDGRPNPSAGPSDPKPQPTSDQSDTHNPSPRPKPTLAGLMG